MKIQQSAEDYLETILMLSYRKPMIRSIDVVNELGYSKPSVSVAMKNLRENGYISMAVKKALAFGFARDRFNTKFVDLSRRFWGQNGAVT